MTPNKKNRISKIENSLRSLALPKAPHDLDGFISSAIAHEMKPSGTGHGRSTGWPVWLPWALSAAVVFGVLCFNNKVEVPAPPRPNRHGVSQKPETQKCSGNPVGDGVVKQSEYEVSGNGDKKLVKETLFEWNKDKTGYRQTIKSNDSMIVAHIDAKEAVYDYRKINGSFQLVRELGKGPNISEKEYCYDDQGRLAETLWTQEYQELGAQKKAVSCFKHYYNEKGLEIRIDRLKSKDDKTPYSQIVKEYDENNELVKSTETDSAPHVIKRTRKAIDNATEVTVETAPPFVGSIGWLEVERQLLDSERRVIEQEAITYADSLDRAEEIICKIAREGYGPAIQYEKQTHVYDKNGRLTQSIGEEKFFLEMVRQLPGPPGSWHSNLHGTSKKTDYVYDAKGRLQKMLTWVEHLDKTKKKIEIEFEYN